MGYIYMLTDKRNGKQYIGKHNGNKKNYWSSGLIPNRIAKKHGREIFDRVILEDNIPSEKLNEREIVLIKQYNSFMDGYNASFGGDGGGHWIYSKTDDEKKEIAKIKSLKLTGRIFSDETKVKMSNSAKVKIFSDEHKLNIGRAVKLRGGFPHSDETKQKLSQIMSGRTNASHSEFMTLNNPKAVAVSIEGTIYRSIKEACIKLSLSRPVMKNRLNSYKEKYKEWFRVV